MSDFAIEKNLWLNGYQYIAGVDEVGRGPIAGPVLAAAVIFPACLGEVEVSRLEAELVGIDDSKKLTASQRERCFQSIRRYAIGVGISAIFPCEIDQIGIGVAVRRVMAMSIARLAIKPDFLLIDGKIPPTVADFDCALTQRKTRYHRHGFLRKLAEPPLRTVVAGDSISLSISAASIIAKVTRDRMMTAYRCKYPGYGFEMHKGYGTANHLERIARLGPTPIHRYSFSPLVNRELEFDNE